MIKQIYKDFYKQNWKLYLVYTAAFVSIPIRQIMIPHYYGKIIDKMKEGMIKESAKLLFILLFIWIAVQFLSLAKEKVHSIMWPRFNYFAQERIFERILNAYDSNFEELKVGEILTKLIKLPWILDNIQDEVGLLFVNHILITASNIVYLSYNSMYLGGFYITSILVYFLVARRFMSGCKHYKVQSEKQYDFSHGYIEDVISNLLTVYSSNRKTQELINIHNINQTNIKVEISRQYCNLKYKLIFSILNIFVFLGLNGISMYLFKIKKLTIQSLVSVFILTFSILNTLIMYYDSSKSLVAIMGDMKYIREFLNGLPEDEDLSEQFSDIKNDYFGCDINLNNITYKIGNKTIYDDLSLTIKRNESVLITGPIGSGKSTFAKLLVKLIKPLSGNITINDININSLSVKCIRDKIVYIPQSPILFDRSLWENITYGLDTNKVTKEKLYAIMNEINIDKQTQLTFKTYLENGNSVGKRGSGLSGGQRQIIWILRALLSDVRVIILDEPTSALDHCIKTSILSILDLIVKKNKIDATSSASETNIGHYSLVIITHDQDVMDGIAFDSVIKFNKGKAIKCKYGEDNELLQGLQQDDLRCDSNINVCD